MREETEERGKRGERGGKGGDHLFRSEESNDNLFSAAFPPHSASNFLLVKNPATSARH